MLVQAAEVRKQVAANLVLGLAAGEHDIAPYRHHQRAGQQRGQHHAHGQQDQVREGHARRGLQRRQPALAAGRHQPQSVDGLPQKVGGQQHGGGGSQHRQAAQQVTGGGAGAGKAAAS